MVTVAPSPVGQTFSGDGDKSLAPVTLMHGVTVSWTAQPDSDGLNQFEVSSSPGDESFIEFDNGDSSTSGTSFVPPGTYTFDVSASAAWTNSF